MPLLRFKRIFYFKKIILGRVLKQLKKLPRKRRFLKKIHIMKKKPFTGLKIKKKINYRIIKKSQFFLPKPVLLSKSVDSFSKFESYKASIYEGYNVFNKHRTEFVKNKIKSFLILQKVTKKNSFKRLLVPKNDIFTHKKRFLAWAVKKNYNSLRKHFNEVLNPEHKVYKHARKLLRSFRGSPKKLVSKIKLKTRKARKYAYYNNFLRQIKFLKPVEDSNIKKRKHVNMPMHKLLTSFKFLDPTVFSNLTRTASSFASIFAYRKRKRLLKRHPFIRLKLSKHRFKSDRSWYHHKALITPIRKKYYSNYSNYLGKIQQSDVRIKDFDFIQHKNFYLTKFYTDLYLKMFLSMVTNYGIGSYSTKKYFNNTINFKSFIKLMPNLLIAQNKKFTKLIKPSIKFTLQNNSVWLDPFNFNKKYSTDYFKTLTAAHPLVNIKFSKGCFNIASTALWKQKKLKKITNKFGFSSALIFKEDIIPWLRNRTNATILPYHKLINDYHGSHSIKSQKHLTIADRRVTILGRYLRYEYAHIAKRHWIEHLERVGRLRKPRMISIGYFKFLRYKFLKKFVFKNRRQYRKVKMRYRLYNRQRLKYFYLTKSKALLYSWKLYRYFITKIKNINHIFLFVKKYSIFFRHFKILTFSQFKQRLQLARIKISTDLFFFKSTNKKQSRSLKNQYDKNLNFFFNLKKKNSIFLNTNFLNKISNSRRAYFNYLRRLVIRFIFKKAYSYKRWLPAKDELFRRKPLTYSLYLTARRPNFFLHLYDEKSNVLYQQSAYRFYKLKIGGDTSSQLARQEIFDEFLKSYLPLIKNRRQALKKHRTWMPRLRIVLKGPMFKFKKLLKRLRHWKNKRIRKTVELVVRGSQPPHNGCSPRVRKRKRRKAVSFRWRKKRVLKRELLKTSKRFQKKIS